MIRVYATAFDSLLLNPLRHYSGIENILLQEQINVLMV